MPMLTLQEKQMAAFAGRAARRLPEGLDYGTIRTLSKESREKLAKARTTHPSTVLTTWYHTHGNMKGVAGVMGLL